MFATVFHNKHCYFSNDFDITNTLERKPTGTTINAFTAIATATAAA